uniref:Ubiquitin-like domain-containing protein n=1 Tax=Lygus hesperus TaxID=30085 RepID=A0A146LZB6_LYGHE
MSSKSCSNASSVRDNLPMCSKDEECPLINDRRHQRQFAHTCRLFPCYHGHIVRHAKLFRHKEGQISQHEGMSYGKVSTHAISSVNFSSISPDAPNAYRIYVTHGEKSYEIFGDWTNVRIHTFKRYLHQVYHIRPEAQVLILTATGKVIDDEISSVKECGIEVDCEVQLKLDIDMDEPKLKIDEL